MEATQRASQACAAVSAGDGWQSTLGEFLASIERGAFPADYDARVFIGVDGFDADGAAFENDMIKLVRDGVRPSFSLDELHEWRHLTKLCSEVEAFAVLRGFGGATWQAYYAPFGAFTFREGHCLRLLRSVGARRLAVVAGREEQLLYLCNECELSEAEVLSAVKRGLAADLLSDWVADLFSNGGLEP